MNVKDILRNEIELSHMVVRAYVDDLGDADLLVRSVPGSNHIAWQLGHLISGTQQMLAGLGHQPPELPSGFAAAYSKETASSDDPRQFAPKAELLALVEKMKAASLAAVNATPDAALEAPGPAEMRDYAPTVASVLALLGTHWLMHAGQWVPIRRKLGRPPIF